MCAIKIEGKLNSTNDHSYYDIELKSTEKVVVFQNEYKLVESCVPIHSHLHYVEVDLYALYVYDLCLCI